MRHAWCSRADRSASRSHALDHNNDGPITILLTGGEAHDRPVDSAELLPGAGRARNQDGLPNHSNRKQRSASQSASISFAGYRECLQQTERPGTHGGAALGMAFICWNDADFARVDCNTEEIANLWMVSKWKALLHRQLFSVDVKDHSRRPSVIMRVKDARLQQ